uniref:Uncharacterized protein n=1 Tax=Cacopsylla melanoneura TaxID=428564 RepID=A0A8D9E7N8_9HEMI
MYRNEISSCQIIEIENSKIQNNTEKLSDEDVEPVYGICKDQSEKSPTTSSPKLDGSLFSPPSIIDSCDKATFYWLTGGGTIDGTEKKSETNQSVMDIEEDKNKDSCPIVLEESFDTNLHKETIAMKICNEDKKNEDMRSNIRRELETSDQAEKSLLLSKALLRTIRFSDISMDDFFKVSKSDLFVKYSDLISMSARKSKSRKYPRLSWSDYSDCGRCEP